jgi:orotate phosphoribosyltransferase
MQQAQIDLIELLLRTGALSFGQFVLKSGRMSPYFINTGVFSNGEALATLGTAYADHIVNCNLKGVTHLFGPAYKGIPLAASTSMVLFAKYKRDVKLIYDRKERKDHGERGRLVGVPPNDGDSVLIIEDVVTAGTTLRDVIPFLNSIAKITIDGLLIVADRCERGAGDKSATRELLDNFGINAYPLLTIYEIRDYLTSPASGGYKLADKVVDSLDRYLAEYGVERVREA